MTRHLAGDGETWLTGAVGKPKPSPGPMRWPVEVTTPEGVERAYAVSSEMQPDGLTTIIRLEDGRLFKRTHGHVLTPYEDGE
jgi:hypothetical protein